MRQIAAAPMKNGFGIFDLACSMLKAEAKIVPSVGSV
jgi:hypothetical protein